MANPTQILRRIRSARSVRQWVEAEVFRPVPWIFKGDGNLFNDWRNQVAALAGIKAENVFLVGSASTGYSLSPFKLGRDFRIPGIKGLKPSDIDIAIVDEELFGDLWNVMLTYDRTRQLLKAMAQSGEARGDQLVSTRQNVYWGTISHDCAPLGTDPSRRFRQIFAATSRQRPFLGHSPKARVYRRWEDLLAYHEQSVKKLVRNSNPEGN